jgi:hypothetical protein
MHVQNRSHFHSQFREREASRQRTRTKHAPTGRLSPDSRQGEAHGDQQQQHDHRHLLHAEPAPRQIFNVLNI